MNKELTLDDKNLIVMKLLHYFITEKNYNPIILQGVDNEIWLENLNENYEIIRIVSNHIHNDEQYDFDVFKTKRIVKKIKNKTFSLNMNVFSFFLDMGDSVTVDLNQENVLNGIKITDEKDIVVNDLVEKNFPDLKNNMEYTEKGFELFMKITSDINKHNQEDNKQIEKVFSKKVPYVTYLIIAICIICYIVPILMGIYDKVIATYSVYGPDIRKGEYFRLLTGGFLHGGILHLFFNCYTLYIIGSQVESYLGKTKYSMIYFMSLLIASLTSMTFGGETMSIGASGAIFGIMGALIYFGYHYRVFLGNIVKTQIIPLVLLNLYLGFILTGVDNFAHIGGLIGGVFSTMALGIDNKSTKSEMINGWIILGIYCIFIVYLGFIYTA